MRVFVIAALILMLVPVVAQADVLSYLGEDGTSGNGIDGYHGTNSSNSLWDYVYSITSAGPVTGIWAVVCPVAPVAHWETADWNYLYYSVADGGIPAATPAGIAPTAWAKISELYASAGTPGIVWYSTGTTAPNLFHFQTNSDAYPVVQRYDGDSWTNGEVMSASPEPGSIVLLCMMVGAGGLWRRRRKTRG